MPDALLEIARQTAIPADKARTRPHAIMFQNRYAPGQENKLDPAFVAVDGTRNARTEYREVGLFLRLYHAGQHKAAEYTGIVSPKFREKARITGSDFLRFVERNPGFDVYFINPYPVNAYYSFNVWEHGEICHSGLMLLAQELFNCAGINCNLYEMGRNTHATLLYCNYWLGNEYFWDRFMNLNVRILQAVERLSPRMRGRLFALDPQYPDPVPMLPFVFERLFSTLLLMDPSIKGCSYRYSRDYIMECNQHEQLIAGSFIDVIDEIDRRGEYDARDMAMFRALQRLRRAQGSLSN